MEDDQAGDESSYSFSSRVTPEGIALSDSEKAENLADNLETQLQPATDPSLQAVIEIVDLGLGSYLMSPASEHNLTNPEEVQEPIRGLKDIKAPGPNGIPNAILLTHHFPTGWKYARVISLLKPGKDPVAH